MDKGAAWQTWQGNRVRGRGLNPENPEVYQPSNYLCGNIKIEINCEGQSLRTGMNWLTIGTVAVCIFDQNVGIMLLVRTVS